MEALPSRITGLENRLALVQADVAEVKKMGCADSAAYELKLETSDGILTERKDLDEYLLKKARYALNRLNNNLTAPVSIGKVGAFDILVSAEHAAKYLLTDSKDTVVKFTVKGEYEYTAEAGLSDNASNSIRLDNVFKGVIGKSEDILVKEIAKLKENLSQAEQRVALPFEHTEKIEELTAELNELDLRLSGVTEQQDVILDPSEEGMVETKEENAQRKAQYAADESDYQPVPEDDDDLQNSNRR